MSKEKQIAELGKKSRNQWALKYSDNDNQENIDIVVIEEASTENFSDCKL